MLVMAGFCRLVWAERARQQKSRHLPLFQMDASMMLHLLQGQGIINTETSRMLTVTHEGVVANKPPNNKVLIEHLEQLAVQLNSVSPAHQLPAPLLNLPNPRIPVLSISPKDNTCALPGQIYMFWAGQPRTNELLQLGVGEWVILRPPGCNFGVAGVFESVIPFMMITGQQIHSRWLITLHHRVKITAELPDNRVMVRHTPQQITAAQASTVLNQVNPKWAPPAAMQQLRWLCQHDPVLGAYTAMSWSTNSGIKSDFKRAVALLDDGTAAQPLRLFQTSGGTV